MFTELLAPAGDLECFKQAIYNGADAVYLATERFGARAYAKNLSLDELKEALILAHEIGKKIYVTVNTNLKENEVNDCKNYIKTLYEYGVDGLILADFSMINFVIKHCPNMEAHISTQVGLKDLNDVYFMKSLGAKRCVLAREVSFEEIKKIKETVEMPLEIFAHGALCVSYSGGCLFSSMLSLRSGNRGRCAQNCRREYTLYKDGKKLEKGFHLSMRDLNTSYYLKDLQGIGVDSLKIEGRMKDPEYVKITVSEYRKKMDDPNYEPKSLDTIFHRNYTKGFLFNEDKGQIVDISKRTNEGALIGKVANKVKNLTRVCLNRSLQIGDRVRIEDEENYFFTIDKMYDLKGNEITSSSKDCLLNIFKDIPQNVNIYKMVDSSIDLTITNEYKKGIVINAYGSVNEPLRLTVSIDNKLFEGTSTQLFSKAQSRPIDDETLTKQLKKITDSSFYLASINNNLDGKLFMTISGINEARRNLMDNISSYYQHSRTDFIEDEEINPIEYESNDLTLTAFCTTEEQLKAALDCGINITYSSSNYCAYVNAKYSKVEGSVLVGGYGGIYEYRGHNKIIADYSFNVMNSESLYYLHQQGVDVVTLSLELSLADIRDLYNGYTKKYKTNPNTEIVCYGHQNLMTLKYCPLRRYGECGHCHEHTYSLEDDKAMFSTSRKECITHIYNSKATNLIDELVEISKYTNRIRMTFTTESYDETVNIIKQFQEKLANMHTVKSYFDKETQTRGYYKREIL
ncbi:MAG: DUF3656 domain-containing protein [Acholeplasmatales bacterium]|nr:DUF3656 domain-containing protein [Acholeplasmatales bacterium]